MAKGATSGGFKPVPSSRMTTLGFKLLGHALMLPLRFREPRLAVLRNRSAKATQTNGMEGALLVETMGIITLGKHENFPI
jgi:hypothetical protein